MIVISAHRQGSTFQVKVTGLAEVLSYFNDGTVQLAVLDFTEKITFYRYCTAENFYRKTVVEIPLDDQMTGRHHKRLCLMKITVNDNGAVLGYRYTAESITANGRIL